MHKYLKYDRMLVVQDKLSSIKSLNTYFWEIYLTSYNVYYVNFLFEK